MALFDKRHDLITTSLLVESTRSPEQVIEVDDWCEITVARGFANQVLPLPLFPTITIFMQQSVHVRTCRHALSTRCLLASMKHRIEKRLIACTSV